MTQLLRRVLVATLICLSVGFMMPSVALAYGDLDCSDFGTRERAVYEFRQFPYDYHGLDRDGNGEPCEWNPSPGKWAGIASGLGLLVGRYFGKKKRFGAEGVVSFPKGLLLDWGKENDGVKTAEFQESNLFLVIFGWGVPYFVMTILRDRVYAIGVPPAGLVATTFVLGCGLTYWAASTRDNWI